MPHGNPLISTIVTAFVLAFLLGVLANRFRLPPLVGYLVAGIIVGPHTPGLVADQTLAQELAEIGIILLMFGVGLHFSLKDLASVRAVAVPGAIAQILCATLLGVGLGQWMGWPLGGSLIFGLALSVASTVVLLKALQDRRLLTTERGKIAVGWLIVEDLISVLALVLIPAIADILHGSDGAKEPLAAGFDQLLGIDLGIAGLIVAIVLKISVFLALMLIAGRRVIPWCLHWIAHTGSRELFRLGVLAIALGVAFGATSLFGVSLSLSAFFAGMVLAESELSHRAAQESLPLRDAFSVLFFVSVGMLFDPSIVLKAPLPLLATVFIILIGKSIAAFFIVRILGGTIGAALTISASLAQIGEFSFILAELGIALDFLPVEGRALILAGSILSIILNSAVFSLVDLLKPRLEAKIQHPLPQDATLRLETAVMAESDVSSMQEREEVKRDSMIAANEDRIEAAREVGEETDYKPTRLKEHTILIGFGRVGAFIGKTLETAGVPFLVIEENDQIIALLEEQNVETIAGNAASDSILALANPGTAHNLLIAIPNAFEAGQVTVQARRANPSLRIIVRAHSDAEVDHLEKLGADTVIMGEREIARGMLHCMGLTGPAISA
ncbi:cation:proton antiporter [Beijerinckia indica]|uniref:Sodium/hydrogen exchanger n=1 Tax=Beijerinckia indica subsp. indica (strain ATCC 9039 / DSM 1715 / NCIMB 8712) TaxID=395963 RepID=B2IDP6_BEII9|nr:cation:proton antiporter [Beijerinckia indica]ACB95482.1 sodium/hydrogen exchanger [Beijerinckia indica subsp. indica ATCC 9039]